MEQLHVDVTFRHVGAESGHKTATSLLFCSRFPSSFYRLPPIFQRGEPGNEANCYGNQVGC